MHKKLLTPVAYIAICLVFLMNAGLSAAPVTISSVGADGSERILICTLQGYKWVDVADLQDSDLDSSSQPAPSSGHCPFCATGFHVIDGVIAAATLLVSLSPEQQSHRYDLIGFKLPDYYLFTDNDTRGPPASA